jgi:hypothetical protein
MTNENTNIYPILIATLGRRDVQLVVDIDGTQKRLEIPFGITREVHDYILNRLDECSFYNGDLLRPVGRGKGELTLRNNKLYFNNEALTEPVLYPGLLLKVPEEIKQNSGSYPKSVILLNTNRDKLPKDDKIYKREPYGAGIIISKWINEYLGLGIQESTSNEINLYKKVISYDYLKGDDSYTSWLSEQNNVFYNRVDQLFYSIELDEDDETEYHVYSSTTGGIPLINEFVRASSKYRFHGKNIKLFYVDKDEIEDKVESIDQTQTINPTISLNSRKHAERLIKEGNFIGAYESLRVIGYKEPYPSFINNAELVADYFHGQIPQVDSSPVYLKNIIGLAKKHDMESIHIALLVETYLRQDNLLASVNNMISFGESVIVDMISRMPFVKKLIRGGKRIIVDMDRLKNDNNLNKIFELTVKYNLFKEIRYINGGYSFDSYLSKSEWLDLMEELTKNKKWDIGYGLIDSLRRFIQLIITNDKSISKIGLPEGITNLNYLRNTYTHNMRLIIRDDNVKNELTKFLIDKKMVVKSDNEISFLKSDYVKGIFKDFEINEIYNLYKELETGLINDIKKAEI